MKNRRKQNFEGEANNMQLDKEDTQRSNLNGKCIFNILILLFVFIMFNKLTCKVQYGAWVNAIRVSSFIENVPQINAKPIAFQGNLLGKLPRNRPFFTNHFSAKLASKIPANFPWNQPFFPRIWPWKSREIWFFFSASYQKPRWLLFKLSQIMLICPSLESYSRQNCGFFPYWKE